MRCSNRGEQFESHRLETAGFERGAAQGTATFKMWFLIKPARIHLAMVRLSCCAFPPGAHRAS